MVVGAMRKVLPGAISSKSDSGDAQTREEIPNLVPKGKDWVSSPGLYAIPGIVRWWADGEGRASRVHCSEEADEERPNVLIVMEGVKPGREKPLR